MVYVEDLGETPVCLKCGLPIHDDVHGDCWTEEEEGDVLE